MSVSDDRQRRQPQAHGQPLIGRGNTVTDVAFSPDGRLLASTSADQTVRLWDVPTGTPHAPPLTGQTAAVEGMAFSPDGQLLATDGQDNTAGYGTSRQTQPRGRSLIRHSKSVGRVAFSSNNNLLASTSEDTSIQLWDVANGEPVGPALRAMKDRRGVWRSVPMTSCSAVWETIRSRACGANLLLACGWAN